MKLAPLIKRMQTAKRRLSIAREAACQVASLIGDKDLTMAMYRAGCAHDEITQALDSLMHRGKPLNESSACGARRQPAPGTRFAAMLDIIRKRGGRSDNRAIARALHITAYTAATQLHGMARQGYVVCVQKGNAGKASVWALAPK